MKVDPETKSVLLGCKEWLAAGVAVLTLGGAGATCLARAYGWIEFQDEKVVEHDASDAAHAKALETISEYNQRVIDANTMGCAVGQLKRWWCEQQQLPWGTMRESEEEP